MTLAERLDSVRITVAEACARANRPPESVMLVAVSKTHPAETVVEAVMCGQLQFGENRVEEATGKIQAVEGLLPPGLQGHLTWHMIGHVQSRKAEQVVRYFDIIHSLDSVKLAERYARFAQEANKTVSVLLEMNVSGEESKSGFNAVNWQTHHQALWDEVRQIVALPGLRVAGLMTIAPILDDPEQTRPVFANLRRLRDALAADFPAASWAELSMGMTDDFPVAIEEGATMIRVGRAIFGPRS